MRRVVVTGMGAITPIGNSVDEFWQGLKAGKVGIDEITKFDTTDYSVKLAAEVKRGESKLANEKFVAKAPAHLVEEERNKLADYKEKYATVEARLTQLQK